MGSNNPKISLSIYMIVLLFFVVESYAIDVNNLKIDRSVFLTDTQNSGPFIQDNEGFLWLGSNAGGLFRYDGYELKNYRPPIRNPFPATSVFSMYIDRDGVFWMGTAGEGLVSYDKATNTFTKYTYDENDPYSISYDSWGFHAIQSIAEDKDGTLWFGTFYGLNSFDKETKRFTRYFHDPDNDNSISDNEIRSIHIDQNNVFWIGTHGGGLNKFDKISNTFEHFKFDQNDSGSVSGNIISSIVEDEEGNIWVATNENGLNKFNHSTGKFKRFLQSEDDLDTPRSNNIVDLFEDSSGNIWITYISTAQAGVSILDPKTGKFKHFNHDPNNSNSISSPSVVKVYEDMSGIMWIIHDTDIVDKIDVHQKKFKIYLPDAEEPNSIPSSTVVAVYEDSYDNLWVGTFPTGLSIYDKDNNTFTQYLDDKYYPGIYEDSSSQIWLGSYPGRLELFDKDTKKIVKSFVHDPEDPYSLTLTTQVNAIVEDKFDEDILWLATYDGGVDKFNKKTETFFHYKYDPTTPNTISNNNLWMLFRDSNGILWFPTIGGGLNRFDSRTDTFTHYFHNESDPTSISSNSVNVVFEDSNGLLWVGTGEGFDMFNPNSEKFTRYTVDEGYYAAMVVTINEDVNGNLWLGSAGGDGLLQFNPVTKEMKTYSKSDGIHGGVFYVRNGITDKDGEMWFGGATGLNSFYPEEIIDNSYIPPVVITSFKQGGEEFDLGMAHEIVQNITLDWKQNFFEFEYSGLSYTQPEKNHYMYMLDGFDQEWFDAGTKRFGRYSGLPGGDYVLKIKASNNDGIWNEEGISIDVKVVSPFWKRSWFYYILIISISSIIFIFLKIKTQSVILRNLELEKKVKKRTKQINDQKEELEQQNEQLQDQSAKLQETYSELQELDSKKDQFISIAAHELKTPLTSIRGFSQLLADKNTLKNKTKTIHYLQLINKNTDRLYNLVLDLIDSTRISLGKLKVAIKKIDINAIVKETKENFQPIIIGKGLEFKIDFEKKLKVMADSARLLQILRNLIMNAVENTNSGHIHLRVHKKGRFVVFSVEDTGVGIQMDKKKEIFDRFFQIGNRFKKELGGSGLGLSMCKGLVTLMKGKIWVESEVGKGSIFYFTIPIA